MGQQNASTTASMQIRKGQGGVKRDYVEGRREGGSWHQTQSHKYGDGAIYPAPTILSYCRANHHYMQREQEEEKKRKMGL